MAAVSKERKRVECRTPEGRLLATVEIFPLAGGGVSADSAPLVFLSAEEARDHGEERLQLHERGRYEYCLKPVAGDCELALLPQKGVYPSQAGGTGEDRGWIEPGDYCGLLPLTVIRRDNPAQPLAQGNVEVRSLKMGYREHYRGMLGYIAEQCAGLLLDCRSPTRLRLASLWREDSRILEQQLEFLRHILETPAFRGAVDEVLRNPHRRLEDRQEDRHISRPFKSGKHFTQQLGTAARRTALPSGHPLRGMMPSLPVRVAVQARGDFLDTAENRFAKMVLEEFRDFLAEVSSYLARTSERAETQRLRQMAGRLRGMLETHLSQGFFPDISKPGMLPLGSPVLQRKQGYRELLRFWLQFHAGAQLSWEGGAEIFHAGARNVATLYEYWLFFQLEALFRQKFACDKPLHALVVDKDKAPPQLMLKRGVQLATPVSGVWSKTAKRQLKAEFHFNRKFAKSTDRTMAGSWTRGVQPDYTISVWPAKFGGEELGASEAEALELMVHIHFDAKYRLDRIGQLLGEDGDAEPIHDRAESLNDKPSTAKYADLLKMHAYRDAIRRTVGAYVVYPGNPGDGNKQYVGYHEVLPGLGAFAVRPEQDGKALGMEAVADFLDKVAEHLANRATARERVTYHVAEAYAPAVMGGIPVRYDGIVLPETDSFGKAYRALPPAEEMVLAAGYCHEAQLALAKADEGFVYVRLGSGKEALQVHPNLARVRHVLLGTEDAVVAPGLLLLRQAGFQIHTHKQLCDKLQHHPGGVGVAAWLARAGADGGEQIYAVFATKPDPDYRAQAWDGMKIMELVGVFEADARNALTGNPSLGLRHPRILPLQSVLMARV